MKVGDHVTVVGIHADRGVHTCLVSQIHTKHPDIFLVYPAALGTIDHDNLSVEARWCGPHEEGVVWARGWSTPDALALRSLAALDSSR